MKQIRVLRITNCKECPFSDSHYSLAYCTLKTKGDVIYKLPQDENGKYTHKIPDWCPLEKVKDDKDLDITHWVCNQCGSRNQKRIGYCYECHNHNPDW